MVASMTMAWDLTGAGLAINAYIRCIVSVCPVEVIGDIFHLIARSIELRRSVVRKPFIDNFNVFIEDIIDIKSKQVNCHDAIMTKKKYKQ